MIRRTPRTTPGRTLFPYTALFRSGSLKFSHYSDSIEDFKKRFQGKQYAYIGIDEITHCPYDKFKYLITCNRNAFGIRNRFYGTCNPDPDSWVVRMIAYWIDEEGDPIPERDGVVRYCFMDGDTVDTIYWGDSPEEVYEQAKSIIDPLWKVEYEELGFDKKSMLIKSVTFIKGKLEENIKLIASDPAYVANLAQQGEEQRARDLAGNWKFRAAGDDLIKMGDMEALFNNEQQIGNGMRTASCDLAFEGGDSCVLWFWIGNHIEDIFVCKLDAKKTQMAIENKLREWGVLEENFTYDLNGLGQYFKGYFPVAKPFNNLAACKDKDKPMYANIKSQCAYLLWRAILAKEISINPRLLERKFSGKGFKNLPLRTILMKERKCIRKKADSEDKGFTLISKDVMKKYVGHSPDYFESLLMKFIFHIKPPRQKPRGLGLL